MLDEDEYAEVAHLYENAIKGTKEFRQRWGVSLENPSIHELFEPVRTLYERLTGMKNCHQKAIIHHRISLYGPPCKRCQKGHYELLKPSFVAAVCIQSKTTNSEPSDRYQENS